MLPARARPHVAAPRAYYYLLCYAAGAARLASLVQCPTLRLYACTIVLGMIGVIIRQHIHQLPTQQLYWTFLQPCDCLSDMFAVVKVIGCEFYTVIDRKMATTVL